MVLLLILQLGVIQCLLSTLRWMTALYRPPRKAALDDVMRRVRGAMAMRWSQLTAGVSGGFTSPGEWRYRGRLARPGSGKRTVCDLFGAAALTDELAVRLLLRQELDARFLRRRDGRFDTHILEPGVSMRATGCLRRRHSIQRWRNWFNLHLPNINGNTSASGAAKRSGKAPFVQQTGCYHD